MDGKRVGLAEKKGESSQVEKRAEKRIGNFCDAESSESERGPETEEKAVQDTADDERRTLNEHLRFTVSSIVP